VKIISMCKGSLFVAAVLSLEYLFIMEMFIANDSGRNEMPTVDHEVLVGCKQCCLLV
jgi:hypothetical protein